MQTFEGQLKITFYIGGIEATKEEVIKHINQSLKKKYEGNKKITKKGE
ncbi:MAG: hypothetical protein N2376_03175 [Clostridia bacterium]|nr:hypothetical protein [Clostridia bacterium]